MRKMAAGVVAVGMSCGVAGCLSPAVNTVTETKRIIERCNLTPQEVAMINLDQLFWDIYNKPCDQVRNTLSSYREDGDGNPYAMLLNPAEGGDFSPNTGARYMLMSLDRSATGDPFEVFVDFVDSRLVSADRYIQSVRGVGGTTKALSSSSATSFLANMEPLTSWGEEWSGVAPTFAEPSSWTVAVLAEDYVLYRWTVYASDQDGSSPAPKDFRQVVDAFMDLTK